MKTLIVLLSCFTIMSCVKNTKLEKQEMLETLQRTFSYEMDSNAIPKKFSDLKINHSFVPKERISKVLLSDKVNDNYENYKGRYAGNYRSVRAPGKYSISITIDLDNNDEILDINFQVVRWD